MHYFPGWSEQDVLNMSYEKFVMYLSTIPDYDTDDEGDEEDDKKPGKKAKAKSEAKPEKVGSFNLFDLHAIKTAQKNK